MAQAVDAPFVLDVRSLGRRPGSMAEVHRTVVSPIRIGTEMIAIEAGTEMDLDLRLEAVSEGVLVTGTACGETKGQCARCLEPIEGTVTVFLTELFAYPDSETEKTTSDEEVYRIEDDRIDLEQALIDAVGLELPMSPLCREDCPGLCADCGVVLAVAEPGHSHQKIDPRWAGLTGKLEAMRDEGNG
ncbi:YceD family protein [Gordonia sp. (in: high G+C Gram-positive bacteria)]|uniref:YceD family protein n=1 Tax=Gordonia sp. (in: high G+C Gram-positive bacteria) TaxID=84139 RepID=UPI0039E2E84C